MGLRGAGRLGASGNFPQDEEKAWREAGEDWSYARVG